MNVVTLLQGGSVCAIASAMLFSAPVAAAPAAGAAAAAGQVAPAPTTAKARADQKKADERARKAREAAEAKARAAAPSAGVAAPSGGGTAASADASDADIMVTGVRSSLAQAREQKRESDAIVDVVNAEDIGKLPNNTVGDVIASIPGIAVYRSEGEVNDIRLRGLNDVQTTVGGTPIESGADRVASIADLPADLVKSVEVYKTKTPDQVEGGGAGSVNINFRKPNDFRNGFTFVTNANGRYNDQSRRINYSYSAITNYKRDTAIGTLGAQFGVTVNFNPFLESQARNDPLTNVQARQVVGPTLLPLPTIAPSQVAFFYTTGSRKTPSYNGSLQWANGGDQVTIEGTYAAPTFDRFSNQLFMPVLLQAGSTNTLPALSNIVLVPGTNRIQSVTVSPVTQVGPVSILQTSNDKNFLGKISGSHVEERFKLYAEIALTGGERRYTEFQARNRFVNRPTYDVEFASDEFRFPQMNLNFRDLDLLDPNQYRFFQMDETRRFTKNRTLSSQVDLTLNLYDSMFAPLFDYLKMGVRFSDRSSEQNQAFRGISGLQFTLDQMPEGFRNLVPIAKGFEGTGVQNNARWLSYDRFEFRENYDGLRTFLAQLPGGAAFATELPNGDQAFLRRNNERTFSLYAMTHYKMKLLFPIDGILGVRTSSTQVELNGLERRTSRISVPTATGTTTVVVTNVTGTQQRGQFFAVQPTATARIRFTPKFDLRLSYNVDFRRPSIDDLSPYLVVDETNVGATITTGNPDLKPQTTYKYDAILEWYFGRAGLITVNPYYWDIQGSVTRFLSQEVLNPDSANPLLFNVSRPYNAGKGYRKGVEVQGQTFFTFLPGIIKNFGVAANYTFTKSKLEYDRIEGLSGNLPQTLPLTYTPRNVFNIQGLFERGGLNARVSYNWNGRVLDNVANPIRNSQYIVPRTWMDAAINYSFREGPLRNLSMSIQMQNVLASARRSFYGFPDQPRDVVYMARTYGGRIGYKF